MSAQRSDDQGEPSSAAWVYARESLVRCAIERDDLPELRRLSTLPGGFGSDRMRRVAWYVPRP